MQLQRFVTPGSRPRGANPINLVTQQGQEVKIFFYDFSCCSLSYSYLSLVLSLSLFSFLSLTHSYNYNLKFSQDGLKIATTKSYILTVFLILRKHKYTNKINVAIYRERKT